MISVVIPCYNCEQHIKSSVRSIQNQDIKDVEIFQVMLEDDGTGININNNAKKKKKEKIEKIEEEKDEEEKIDMNKIYHDDTVISQIKENEEKNKDKVKIELSKVGVNEDEEENV